MLSGELSAGELSWEAVCLGRLSVNCLGLPKRERERGERPGPPRWNTLHQGSVLLHGARNIWLSLMWMPSYGSSQLRLMRVPTTSTHRSPPGLPWRRPGPALALALARAGPGLALARPGPPWPALVLALPWPWPCPGHIIFENFRI